MPPEKMPDLAEAELFGQSGSQIPHELKNQHVADIVDYLNKQSLAVLVDTISRMPEPWAVELLDFPAFEEASEVIAALPTARAAGLLEGMSADRAADVLRWIPEPQHSTIQGALSEETRKSLETLLSYPEGTAASLMTTEYLSAPADWTVRQTLDHIREVEDSRETVYAVFVLDPTSHRLLQTVRLRKLISADLDATILSLTEGKPAPIVASPLSTREEVARLISRYDLLAVPVVDSTGHMLGIVTVDDAIDAILEESTEDTQRMGGMEALDEPYMKASFFDMFKKRAGWLGVLFLSEMFTASAMQHYSDELEQAIVLALFIPLVMSSGGNSGSQATSLIIRALALQEVRLRDWFRVALREFPAGLALGAFLGLIGIIRIATWQLAGIYDYGEHWKLIAMAIGASLVGIVTFGSMVGSMLPFILKRLGFDPASASAPFVATFVDVTGIVIYFSIAYVFLKGTLL
ncbi:magnesium transporter [Pseudochelatococcus contaminans]|uniref:Magnesium transporter MgtE n=2 Tax=Pseudochelatococcus contaminans TaxID=1538103 RepID=A0A7W5Z1I0_9HYPH|nr:magnesium transporter [Pseudochelatococcus contaminans]